MVANEPERQTVVVGQVAANTSHIHRVLISHKERHRILLVFRVVDNHNTLCSRESRTRLLNANRVCRFHPDCFAMGTHNGDAHTHSTHVEVGSVHNLLRFVIHLHLFFRVAVVGKHVDVRNYVVRKLVSKLLNLRFAAFRQVLILADKFVHSSSTRTTRCLIGCHVHATYRRQVVDSFQRHNHLNRRTVRVSDDVTRRVERIVAVHFRHYQRHIVVHAECRRVVNHYRSVFGNRLGKLTRRTCSGGSKSYIYTCKVVAVTEFFDCIFLTFKGILSARATLRAEK